MKGPWRPIPGYEDRYRFNPTTGRVYALPRTVKREWNGSISTKRVGGRMLKPTRRPNGRVSYKLGNEDGWRDVFLDKIREMCK